MARSRRPSFRGCCAMCAFGKGKVRGQGRAARETVQSLRQRGKAHRVRRNEIPADQLGEVVEVRRQQGGTALRVINPLSLSAMPRQSRRTTGS